MRVGCKVAGDDEYGAYGVSSMRLFLFMTGSYQCSHKSEGSYLRREDTTSRE